jgi:hypothetical protein
MLVEGVRRGSRKGEQCMMLVEGIRRVLEGGRQCFVLVEGFGREPFVRWFGPGLDKPRKESLMLTL